MKRRAKRRVCPTKSTRFVEFCYISKVSALLRRTRRSKAACGRQGVLRCDLRVQELDNRYVLKEAAVYNFQNKVTGIEIGTHPPTKVPRARRLLTLPRVLGMGAQSTSPSFSRWVLRMVLVSDALPGEHLDGGLHGSEPLSRFHQRPTEDGSPSPPGGLLSV